jgi:hypothetical protein
MPELDMCVCALEHTAAETPRRTLIGVASCAYCGRQATVDIPSIPGSVCLTDALEFWVALLVYVKDCSDRIAGEVV